MPLPKPILEEFGLWPLWARRNGEAAIGEPVVEPAERVAAPEAPAAVAMTSDEGANEQVPIAAPVAIAPPVSPGSLARASVEALDWEGLEARVKDCTACKLCEHRTQTVFGVGDQRADWLLIGEAPGQQEDLQGEPFVGQAGKLLDNILRAVGLQRGANVYIANVLKCRPPKNRDPEPDEVLKCEPYLLRQIALLEPKLIVVMGRFAAQSILRTQASIGSLRGRLHTYQGLPVVVTYHPAYLLRTLTDKSKAWTDWSLARATYESLCQSQPTSA